MQAANGNGSPQLGISRAPDAHLEERRGARPGVGRERDRRRAGRHAGAAPAAVARAACPLLGVLMSGHDASGSTSSGPLFFGLLTFVETGKPSISSDGYGFSRASS